MGLAWQRISGRDFDIVWMSSPSTDLNTWILGWKGYSWPHWRANAIEDPINLFYQRPALYLILDYIFH